MKDNQLAAVRIVMVETSHPGNIGAAARAMATMGLSQLSLVKPKDFPSDVAYRRSAGAHQVLEQASVVDSLDVALADCVFVAGTSARKRGLNWPLQQPRQAVQTLLAKSAQATKPVAIVFGRESSGLSNEELAKCNLQIHVPVNQDYGSLNVAAAVQILAYEIRLAALANDILLEKQELDATHKPSKRDWLKQNATSDEVEGFYNHLDETLHQLQFIKTGSSAALMLKLRRLFNRAELNREELQILRGILSAIDHH